MLDIDACTCSTNEALRETLCDWGGVVVKVVLVERLTCETWPPHLEQLSCSLGDVSDLYLCCFFLVGLDPLCSWLSLPMVPVGSQSGQNCCLTRLLHGARAHYFGGIVVVVLKATETLANLCQLKLQRGRFDATSAVTENCFAS